MRVWSLGGRVQPRRAAVVLFGLYSAQRGVGLLWAPDRTAGLAKVPGPLQLWGVVFLVLAAIIASGYRSPMAAQVSALVAVGVWVAWATFSFNALALHVQTSTGHAAVSPGTPIDLFCRALLFLLLLPYWWRQPGVKA